MGRWVVIGVLVAGCGASSAEEAPEPAQQTSGSEVAEAEPPEPDAGEPAAELPELDSEVARRINEAVDGGFGLFLAGTPITDAGLVHLSGLTSLELLDLNGTQVADAGLAHLGGLTSLRALSLSDTQITDAGLVHLRGLTSLRRLYLVNAQTTEAGRASLRQALPNCDIVPDP